MDYTIERDRIIVGKHERTFPTPISEVIEHDELLIILTKYFESPTNENIWAIDKNCKVVWQVQKIATAEFEGKTYNGISEPYTGIKLVDDSTLRTPNWDGGVYELNPRTGEFKKNIIEFRKGKRPW